MLKVSQAEFESFVEEGVTAIPEKFRALIKNVAFLVADEPTLKQRKQNNLRTDETLLGLYEGIPRTARGEEYGALALPDRITIFQKPIEEEADLLAEEQFDFSMRPHTKVKLEVLFRAEVRRIVIDTVWHEVAHHFGLGESAVLKREQERGVTGSAFS